MTNPIARSGYIAALCLAAGPLAAQSTPSYTPLRWWHPVVASAGVAALFLIDEPVADAVQDLRGTGTDDVADVAKRFKDPAVFYVAGGGAIAAGLVSGRAAVTRTGFHILAAYGLSSAMMIGTKWAFGRTRPSTTPDDPATFNWFDGGSGASFPSGSAAVVFSLATTVADAIDRTPVSVALYGGAALNSWSRLNGNRHWLSDVALGALYGVTASKLVTGRWRIFGLAPPSVWIGPGEAQITYALRW